MQTKGLSRVLSNTTVQKQDLSAHVTEMEEDLDTARKDLLKSTDVNRKLKQDIHEVSDSGCVCCPEVECGSLVLPGISALAWLRE